MHWVVTLEKCGRSADIGVPAFCRLYHSLQESLPDYRQFAIMYGNVPLFILWAVKMGQLLSKASHGSEAHPGECATVLKLFNSCLSRFAHMLQSWIFPDWGMRLLRLKSSHVAPAEVGIGVMPDAQGSPV
jgi:hypothetical protein